MFCFIKKNLLSIVSLFVAACALIVTVIQVNSINYHNRISLLPLIQTEIYESDTGELSISLENKGNGTAIITDLEVNGHSSPSVLTELKKSMGKNGYEIKNLKLRSQTFTGSAYMRPGDKFVIAVLFSEMKEPKAYEFAREALYSLPLTVCYKSLYQDKLFTTTSSKHLLESSCAYSGTFEIFGTRIKLHLPFSSQITQKEML